MTVATAIMNVVLSAVVLATILGMLGWAIRSSRDDDPHPLRLTRRHPMPRPSFPTPRVTLRRPGMPLPCRERVTPGGYRD